MTSVPSDPLSEPPAPGEATAAGVYDYMLGGTTNTQADAWVAGQLLGAMPMMGRVAKYNREFLQRAVRFLTAAGIRQFLDLGSGVPTVGNVHEIAQAAAPGARVVYVDYSQQAVNLGRELLAANPDTTSVLGDLREPEAIFRHPEVRALLNLEKPVALLMFAVLHFITDDEHPADLVQTYTRRLRPGSYLAISHGARISDWQRLQARQDDVTAAYNYAVAEKGIWRSTAEIQSLFGVTELVPPGLVYLPDWRPDPPGYTPDPEDEARKVVLGGVGRIG